MIPYFLALAGGVLTALAHPKVSWSYLAFFSLVPVLEAVRLRPQRAFLFSFLAGFSYFLFLLYWLVPVMVRFGGLPLPAAVGVLGLLAAYLALFWALPVKIFVFTGRLKGSLFSAFFFAALFTSFEFIRAKVPYAFPWGILGASQYRELFLIQIADFGGVFAVSFLLTLVNYALFSFMNTRKKSFLALCFLALLGAYLYGAARLETQFNGPAQRVGLVQGNVPQDLKWDRAFLQETIAKYQKLSREAVSCGAEVVIWPETAFPLYLSEKNKWLERLLGWQRQLAKPLIFGAPYYELKGERFRVYNSLFLLRDGKIVGRYDKQRLVPFGEFVPFEKTLPWLRTLAVASGEYAPGPRSLPLKLNPHQVFGPLICFESIFPDLARQRVRDGATVLLVATNDAWFDATAGPYQHFAQAVFRAIETRRYVIRVANTGISGLIDPYGRVIKQTPLEKEAAPCVTAKHLAYFSWYTRYGDLFSLGCLGLTLAVSVSAIFRRERL